MGRGGEGEKGKVSPPYKKKRNGPGARGEATIPWAATLPANEKKRKKSPFHRRRGLHFWMGNTVSQPLGQNGGVGGKKGNRNSLRKRGPRRPRDPKRKGNRGPGSDVSEPLEEKEEKRGDRRVLPKKKKNEEWIFAGGGKKGQSGPIPWGRARGNSRPYKEKEGGGYVPQEGPLNPEGNEGKDRPSSKKRS